jgi:hypothetical protein
MVLDKWLSGELSTPTEDDTRQALNEVEKVAQNIEMLTKEKEYWEAYRRLTGFITFLSTASQQHPTRQPEIIQQLLKWIQKIKGAIDTVIQGIGGSGYSITVSVQGLSLTVSFTIEAS